MAEMLPHVWDTRGGFLSFTSIADISTALMRPRRPKQYCLQLVSYIYIYIHKLEFFKRKAEHRCYKFSYSRCSILQLSEQFCYAFHLKTRLEIRHLGNGLPAQRSVSISTYDVKSSKKSDPAASSSCVLYIL